jgi:asparagine synthase (glutamine-hydrolysing)
MCGIAGKILYNGQVTIEHIAKMTNALQHRGPDGEDVYISKNHNVGLGHRRLSIIDLSERGKQPMAYLNRYHITFNGEIYNYQSLRRSLEAGGHRFQSETDTEVILALYAEHGIECLKHLRGMFAFVIYDQQQQTIFCARDRMGQKPFKYCFNDEVFMFASELKAILTQPEYKKEVDYRAVHHYLTYQYVPAPLTGFKDIYKLLPGHYLLLDINSKKVDIKQYWDVSFSNQLTLSENEWGDRILETLEESVKIRMRSDVPLGAFLSGGVDSSAVVAMMARNSTQPIKTFSIGFKEKEFNELPYAKQVADLFDTDHKEFIVEPDMINVLPELVYHYEEPYADSSQLPTYYVSKHTKDFVTVALNGDGGDENFGGYSRYSLQKFTLWYERFSSVNKHIVKPSASMMSQLFKSDFFNKCKRFTDAMDQRYEHRYINYICYFSNEMKQQLYHPDFVEKTRNFNPYDGVADIFQQAGTDNKLDQTFYFDIKTYLPDDLLVKVDIATMMVSLEGRSPFLDHNMVELAASIPAGLKIRGGDKQKYILKKSLKGLLPDNILHRKKRGFGIPINYWFRHQLKEYLLDTLLSERAIRRNLFLKKGIHQLISKHQNNAVNHGHRLWSLLTLELWFQRFFDD